MWFLSVGVHIMGGGGGVAIDVCDGNTDYILNYGCILGVFGESERGSGASLFALP